MSATFSDEQLARLGLRHLADNGPPPETSRDRSEIRRNLEAPLTCSFCQRDRAATWLLRVTAGRFLGCDRRSPDRTICLDCARDLETETAGIYVFRSLLIFRHKLIAAAREALERRRNRPERPTVAAWAEARNLTGGGAR